MNNKGLYDLEELLIKIYDDETRELMKEAVLSYNVGAYRGAVLLTWNTVIYDAYKKIEYLGRVFEDSQAKDKKNRIDKNLKSGILLRNIYIKN